MSTQTVNNYATAPPKIQLVGRKRELDLGLQALKQQRYVEITGPPGEGKSMLAQHLVQSLHQEWKQLPADKTGREAHILQLDMQGRC